MNWKPLSLSYSDRARKLSELRPHQVLEIPEGATKDEIKNAYRRLVKIYHPDTADNFIKKSNAEVLKVINEAYGMMIGKNRGQ